MKEPEEKTAVYCFILHQPRSCLSKINLLNYSTVQPLMRVGRSTPSSYNGLVVGGLTNMSNKCLTDKIIKYNYGVSGLRNPNMVSVLEEGLQESQNSTRNQPRICLGSSSTMLNYQHKYVSFLDNSREKRRLRWKKSQKHPISTGSILFVSWAG